MNQRGDSVRGLELPGISERLAQDGEPTLLESKFPFRELSLVAAADQRASDPVYAAHRWWARRPPSIFRGAILAAALGEGCPEALFWAAFASSAAHLRGLQVYDPFAGGGTTLVEAARLGAVSRGRDVDPLAVEIVRHELRRPDREEVRKAGEQLIDELEARLGKFYGHTENGWEPLHYFYLHSVKCPGCRNEAVLYRSLIIARDLGKIGGVKRDARVVAFCPECFGVHNLRDKNATGFRCCGKYQRLEKGTFTAHRFTCPACSGRYTHPDLKTGSARKMLLAVEETSGSERRRIRDPKPAERMAGARAAQFLKKNLHELRIPPDEFTGDRRDARPVSFGLATPKSLLNARQLAVFGSGFAALHSTPRPEPVQRALRLMLSSSLTTNNMLCGYATDYGRLAPLFSVRSYSIPALVVELNPFHRSAGRGTLRKNLERILASLESTVRRYVWCPSNSKVKPVQTDYSAADKDGEVACASAVGLDRGPFDLCLFDPPYFDYIAYSELSEFYRAWIGRGELGGPPLLPEKDLSVQSFGETLGQAMTSIFAKLRPGSPFAFTYHSTNAKAYEALLVAMDRAGAVVTALWPVLSDGHMGHHAFDGNCEWDLLIVCRRSSECVPVRCGLTVSQWRESVRPLRIRKADTVSLQLALQILGKRFASPMSSRLNRAEGAR